jgi:galactokinase
LLGIFIAAWSLGAEPDAAGLLFTYATTTAAVIVMFALPGSQVGWDAIFLALLTTTAGLSMPDALAVAIVVRIQQLCIMCIGAVALTWLARTSAYPEE